MIALRLALIALCLAAAGGARAATKGFAVTWFAQAMVEGDDECPEGLAVGPDVAASLAPLPAAEQARLRLLDNERELGNLVVHRGPGGKDVCVDPTSVPDPGFRIVQDKIAYGLNLDGGDGKAVAPNTCAHEKFVGPAGEPGIDNQWYRLRGCIKSRRHDGFLTKYHNAQMRSGEATILIEIAGIADGHDGDVQVGLYGGVDPMVTDAGGNVLPDVSLQVRDDPRFQAVAHGTLKNGVVTTDPVDVHLPADTATGKEYYFRGARLSLQLLPDGNAKGMLAGYLDLPTVWEPFTTNQISAEKYGPLTCPGFYNALQRLADGYPDPKTGRCTAISAAYDIEAIPAFVIHPNDAKKTAQAGAP